MKKLFLVFLLSSVFLLCSSCNNPESSDQNEFIKINDEEKGIFPFSNIKGINIENSRGGIIIYGTTINDTISYVLSKTIIAKTDYIAQNHIDDINIQVDTEEDTLHCSVLYPFPTDDLEPFGYIDMSIPRELPCKITKMVEGIFIFYMANDICVRDVKDHIDIKDHMGSCDVHTKKGDVKIEIAIPDSGYCRAKTDNGDIILTIPHQTSANIYAKTYSGSIINQNFDISNLNQSANSLSGKLGTGRGEIFLETKSGNIFIRGI